MLATTQQASKVGRYRNLSKTTFEWQSFVTVLHISGLDNIKRYEFAKIDQN